MTTLLDVIRAHIPRDRYDDEGFPVGTWCICGDWEGDWFADGEAGAFDEHLAGAVGGWLTVQARDATMLAAVGEALKQADPSTCPHHDDEVGGLMCCDCDALTALTAFVGTLGESGAPASVEVDSGATDSNLRAQDGASSIQHMPDPYHQLGTTDSGEAARGTE